MRSPRALTELLAADGRIEVAGRAREGREGVDLLDAREPDVVPPISRCR
jgi:chemotaxis response regulator CheB